MEWVGRALADSYEKQTELDGFWVHLDADVLDPSIMPVGPRNPKPICLGEFLMCSQDDPASMALRNIDWQGFLDSHDYRYGVILRDLAEGKNAMDISRNCGDTYFHVRSLKERLENDLREYLGSEAVEDSCAVPAWRSGVRAYRGC